MPVLLLFLRIVQIAHRKQHAFSVAQCKLPQKATIALLQRNVVAGTVAEMVQTMVQNAEKRAFAACLKLARDLHNI